MPAAIATLPAGVEVEADVEARRPVRRGLAAERGGDREEHAQRRLDAPEEQAHARRERERRALVVGHVGAELVDLPDLEADADRLRQAEARVERGARDVVDAALAEAEIADHDVDVQALAELEDEAPDDVADVEPRP